MTKDNKLNTSPTREIRVVGPSGETGTVPANELSSFLKEGWKLETPGERSVREYVADNSGITGAIKVAAGQFLDEALMGIPETIYNQKADPLEVAKKDALKKEHQLVNDIAGVAGFGTSLLVPGGAIGRLSKGAEATGKLVANRVVGEGVAQNLAREIAKKGIQYGTEGVVMAMPMAITEASLGDTETALETLIMSGGIGAGLGMSGPILREAGKWTKNKAVEAGNAVAKKAYEMTGVGDDTANMLVGRTMKEGQQLSPETVQELRLSVINGDKKAMESTLNKAFEEANILKTTTKEIPKSTQDQWFSEWQNLVPKGSVGKLKPKDQARFDQLTQDLFTNPKSIVEEYTSFLKAQPKDIEALSRAGKGTKTTIGEDFGMLAGIEYLVPGLGKWYAAGRGLQKIRNTSPKNITQALYYTEQAMKKAGEALDKIPSYLQKTRLDNIGITNSVGAINRMLDDDKISRHEAFDKLSNKITELKANPALSIDLSSELGTALAENGAPQLGQAYSAKQQQILDYLDQNLPKSSKVSNPLRPVKYKPTDSELATFERKLQAVSNPLSILPELQRGTLRKESVDAVKAVYPKLYQNIQTRIIDFITTNPDKLDYKTRLQLQKLLDIPATGFTPTTIQQLQSNFMQQEEQTKGTNVQVPDITTDIQKLSNK